MAAPAVSGPFTPIAVGGVRRNISASTACKASGGMLAGIFVASASATPTIKVWDNPTAASGAIIVNTFTPIAAGWYPMPFPFSEGLFVEISGTVDCTVSFI